MRKCLAKKKQNDDNCWMLNSRSLKVPVPWLWHSSLLEKQFRITDKRVGLTQLINLDWLTATLTDVFVVSRNKVKGLARCGDWTSGSYYSTFLIMCVQWRCFAIEFRTALKQVRRKITLSPDTHHIFDHVYRFNDFF